MSFNDKMVARLEKELFDRNAQVAGITEAAERGERDFTAAEKTTLVETRARMVEIKDQLETLEAAAAESVQVRARMEALNLQIEKDRGEIPTYVSPGAYMLDRVNASLGSREAQGRIEHFMRVAAHQKTADNLGIVPDPITGEVLNFIDEARPMVSTFGVRPMPSATWYRPKVTAHTSVAKQGTAGAAADEKTELSSTKMTITRLTGTAVTYGGYVNVSRQNIDFSSPDAMDAVVRDLAAQYAIQTEAAVGAALATVAATELTPPAVGVNPTVDQLVGALWTSAGTIYNATKGQGRLCVFVNPSKLAVWGSAFAPVNPTNAQGSGFAAGQFGQGVMGTISGIPVICTSGVAGAAADLGVVASTAAVEVYEQRVGTLSSTEPSVLGTQVAYAGYFTPMIVESGGIVRLVNAV